MNGIRGCLAKKAHGKRGQSLVEMALVLPLLATLLLGIAEFGFMFTAYVQVSNAAREGARAGSRYIYVFSGAYNEQALNDQQRGWGNGISGYQWYGRSPVVRAVQQELEDLPSGGFNPGSYAAPKDLVITYPDTGGPHSSGPRWMDHIRVRVTYHYQMPVVSSFLPAPATVDLVSETTMAIQDR